MTKTTTTSTRTEIRIADRLLGEGHQCLIIAEVAQAHDGSLGFAHSYIDAIAKAGADAVKFQTHVAAAESSIDEPWRVKFSRQDATRYDYWKRMEFSEEQWKDLKEHADQSGLIFLSSPFSVDAVDMLTRVGVPAWKIASGEINDQPILERMVETGLPLLVSLGMSNWAEIDATVGMLKAMQQEFVLFQTTSVYPCPPERIGLNIIGELRERYRCQVGFSDHSGVIFPSMIAVALGANAVEVHVTLSREMFGPDVTSSLTPSELSTVVKGIRYVESILANPVNKDSVAKELAPMRTAFMKSVVATTDLPAGTVLKREHLTAKKPGTGIPASRLSELIGCRLSRVVRMNQRLQEEDLERIFE